MDLNRILVLYLVEIHIMIMCFSEIYMDLNRILVLYLVEIHNVINNVIVICRDIYPYDSYGLYPAVMLRPP
jgi:hypothetical protein